MRSQLLSPMLLLLFLALPVSLDSGGGDEGGGSGGGGSSGGSYSSRGYRNSGGSGSCGTTCGIIVGSVAGAVVIAVLVVYLCRHRVCRWCTSSTITMNVPKTEAERKKRTEAALSTTVQFPPREITACRKGHELVYTKSDQNRYLSAGAWQKCNCCGNNFDLRNGSWRCESCDFDICPSCKSPHIDETLKYPTCKQGHILVKSIYYGMYRRLPYYGGQYQCAACFQSKSCSSGRWFCVFCLVDVCDECQKRHDMVQAPVDVLIQPVPPEQAATQKGQLGPRSWFIRGLGNVQPNKGVLGTTAPEKRNAM